MLKIIENKIFITFSVIFSYLFFIIFYQSETSGVYRRSLLLFNNTIQHAEMKRFSSNPNEKYITFFTHSGFQNQLIQVENGILLAWYLNRTLILPKAVLGEAFGWSPFEKLELHHRIRETSTKRCRKLRAQSPYSFSCPNQDKYTLTSFDDLFDLSWARQHVKIITRESSDFEWLARYFGIRRIGITKKDTGIIKDGDILFFKGESRYDWRIFDMPRKTKFLGKYNDSLEISQLLEQNEKLIHFTSLFGTGKMPVRKPEHIAFLNSLQKSITYNHPAVLVVAREIIQLLGGEGHFVGIHLRTADGPFVNTISENIDRIISQLDLIQKTYNTSIDNSNAMNTIHHLNEPFPSSSPPSNTLKHCLHLTKSKQAMIIFLATDAAYPNRDLKFSPLYKSYPCIFTIADLLNHDDDSVWSIMDQYRTFHTNQSMRKFLIPLVDALVASKGHRFIGTEGSTFSGYIRRLHHHFWNTSTSI